MRIKLTIVFLHISYIFISRSVLSKPNMPLTNGDVATSSSPLSQDQKLLDCTSALEYLKNEYKHQDGLDVQSLLDSRSHGGLTYNDFLVLPGYIGTTTVSPACRVLLLTTFFQAFRPQMLPSTLL